MSRYFCCDERRREAVRGHVTLNGIDFLEVADDPALSDAERLARQRILQVHCIKPIADGVLDIGNIRIEGGERISGVEVLSATISREDGQVLLVTVDRVGDFSPYILRLVSSEANHRPPTGFDLRLSTVEFSFKIACPSDFDCLEARGLFAGGARRTDHRLSRKRLFQLPPPDA